MSTEPLAGAGVRRAFGTGPAVSLFTLGTMRALKDASKWLPLCEQPMPLGSIT